MSESNFLIILGSGCHYSGVGIVPDKVLTYFDDKAVAVWLLNDIKDDFKIENLIGGGKRFLSKRKTAMDDAMLMISLYVLGEESGKCETLQELIRLSEEKFKKDIFKVNSLDSTDLDLTELYEINKKVFQEFASLKFVAISMRSLKRREYAIKDKLDDIRDTSYLSGKFLVAMKNYGVNYYEVCETLASNYSENKKASSTSSTEKRNTLSTDTELPNRINNN